MDGNLTSMTGTSQKPITTAEFAYNTIKEWILIGQCSPGQHIKHNELAEKMEISRVPIRSALDKLAAEGLVSIQPHKGAIVTPVSADDLINIFTLRFYLEPIAVLEAMEKSTREELCRLRSLLDSQDHNSVKTEVILRQNQDFHYAIFLLSGNEILIKTLENLWEKSDRYRRFYFAKPRNRDRIVAEHYEIAELLCSGKKQEVADKIAHHTWLSLEILLKEIFNKTISLPFAKIQVK